MRKSVVITGASTGIGWASAKVLIAKGFQVFGSVRKQADADRLKAEFGDHFTPLLFDVTDEAAVRAGAKQVEAALAGQTLAGLVNNAGVAFAGPLLLPAGRGVSPAAGDQPDWRGHRHTGLRPVLRRRERPRGATPGRIVNISSVGGKNANPFMGPYCTTKFGLEGLSESLRRELMPFGVDVVIVAPGAVATPDLGQGRQRRRHPLRQHRLCPGPGG
jgi:NAD(P)-dependent dehydrogenase (short-subunit alcohol dehydrogenase family)